MEFGRLWKYVEVHVMVFIAEGRAEVSPQYIEHIPAILQQQGVVHMVFGFDVPFYYFRKRSFAIEWTTWGHPHDKKTDSDDYQ